jgi:lipopolysaccharide heptosyltransferase II
VFAPPRAVSLQFLRKNGTIPRRMREIISKTLVIRFSSAGDIILATPLLRALRTRFPSAEIDFAVKREFAGLLRHDPALTNVLELPASRGGLRWFRSEVRARRYDLLIDIHGSLRSRYLCLGAPRVVRLRKRVLARLMLVRFKRNVYDRWGGSPPVIDRYFEPVLPYGVRNDGLGAEMFPSPDDETAVAVLLAREGIAPGARCVALVPGARHWNKRWPGDRFAETGAMLARETGSDVLVVGGPDDVGLCGAVAAGIRTRAPEARVMDLSGSLTLNGCGLIMDRASVVITNDTALMHVAAARRRPVVAVFGPTVREFGFFPSGTQNAVFERNGLECRPCTHVGLSYCPAGHFRCMLETDPSAVVRRARAFMES